MKVHETRLDRPFIEALTLMMQLEPMPRYGELL